MIHYIEIKSYLQGDSMHEQIMKIVEAGQFDEDLRIFFNDNAMVASRDILYLTRHDFEVWGNTLDLLMFKPKKLGYWQKQFELKEKYKERKESAK